MSKHLLTISTSFSNCFSWVIRETILLDDKLVKIIFKKVSTIVSAMSIINSKERTFWPIFKLFFALWSNNVKDDWYSIFVVSSYYSLVSISSISMNNTILLWRRFGWLFIRKNEICWLNVHFYTKKYVFNNLIVWQLFIINHSYDFGILGLFWFIKNTTSLLHRFRNSWAF